MTNDELIASVTGKAPTSLAGQIAVMQAYDNGVDGHGVILLFKRKEDVGWSDCVSPPAWNWSSCEYCIAPESFQKPVPKPKYRPYSDDELYGLLGKSIRLSCGCARLVVRVNGCSSSAKFIVLDDMKEGLNAQELYDGSVAGAITILDGSTNGSFCGVPVE